MPDPYQGKAVSNDDSDVPHIPCSQSPSGGRDERYKDSRRHFPFVAHTTVSPRLPVSAQTGSGAGVTAADVGRP